MERDVRQQAETEPKQPSELQTRLLEASVYGGYIHHKLMIGDQEAPTDVTFEDARTEMHAMISEGLIMLDSEYRLQLTDKGSDTLRRMYEG